MAKCQVCPTGERRWRRRVRQTKGIVCCCPIVLVEVDIVGPVVMMEIGTGLSLSLGSVFPAPVQLDRIWLGPVGFGAV